MSPQIYSTFCHFVLWEAVSRTKYCCSLKDTRFDPPDFGLATPLVRATICQTGLKNFWPPPKWFVSISNMSFTDGEANVSRVIGWKSSLLFDRTFLPEKQKYQKVCVPRRTKHELEERKMQVQQEKRRYQTLYSSMVGGSVSGQLAGTYSPLVRNSLQAPSLYKPLSPEKTVSEPVMASTPRKDFANPILSQVSPRFDRGVKIQALIALILCNAGSSCAWQNSCHVLCTFLFHSLRVILEACWVITVCFSCATNLTSA